MFIGRTLEGKYRLQSLLGEGSFGGVFRADELIGERIIGQVAVKLIRPHPDLSPERQLDELIIARQLRDPHILVCHNVGMLNYRGATFLCMVMELAEESLRTRLDRGALRSEETEQLADSLSSALVYLHQRTPPLAHRDIKPANILRVGTRWLLTDFGVARPLDSESALAETASGTPIYKPPEAYAEKRISSTSSDMWALGVVLLEAITGIHPFAGGNSHPILAIMHEEPTIPVPVPAQLREVIRGCLKKNREERWSATAVKKALATPPSIAVSTRSSSVSHVEHPPVTVHDAQVPSPTTAPLSDIAQTIRINPIDGAEMIYVPPGPFIVGGKQDDWYVNEEDTTPKRTITLPGFWMYRNLVTVAQYKHYCTATRRKMPRPPEWGWEDLHPIVNITFAEAIAYTAWAKAQLPSEAQWEKAVRGTDGRLYPWGTKWNRSNDINCNLDDYHGTRPVGSITSCQSIYGIQDLLGNVWEFCYPNYGRQWKVVKGRKTLVTVFFEEPFTQSNVRHGGDYWRYENGDLLVDAVCRGGSWRNSDPCHSAVYRNGTTGGSDDDKGFRCVIPSS